MGRTISKPRGFTWYCYSHAGGARGILDALGQHELEMSDLVLTEESVSTNSDTDPLPDHQHEYHCENPRRILHHLKKLGRVTAMPVRCRRCQPCAAWLQTKRLGRLNEAVRDWTSVRMVELDAKAFEALSRRLRRRADQYVSVPVEGGRIVLTDTPLDIGAIVSPEDVGRTIQAVVGVMVAGRISGTMLTLRKPRKLEDVGRTRIGITKLSPEALEVVFSRHGCPKVALIEQGTAAPPTWDVAALSEDRLLALWTAAGVRVWKE